MRTSPSPQQLTPAQQDLKEILTNALRSVVGPDELFEIETESLGPDRAKMILVTESKRVMVAWVEVQEAWEEVMVELKKKGHE
jgi:hypothetical protein